MPTLALDFAQPVTADGRRMTGVAVPYGVASNPTTNGNRYRFAGPPQNLLDRVDAVREHDEDAVIGCVESWDQLDAALGATVRAYATTAGNDVLVEASEGVRAGFSIGAHAEADDLELAADGVYDVRNWTARHLGIVRRPALEGAQISHIAASQAPADGDQEEETDDVEPDAEDTEEEGDVPEQSETTTIDAGAQVPAHHRRSTTQLLTLSGQPAPRTFAEAAARLALSANARGITATSGADEINAALADIIPAPPENGLANAFLRPQWLGELWTPEYSQRDFVDAIGSQPLTSMKWDGWKWEERPQVDKWVGNKTEIPTNPVVIVPATGEAYRVAGGWDVDRIFIDLGSPGFVEALFRAATADYRMKSEGWLAEDVLDTGTVPPDPAPDSVVGALDVIVRALTLVGARLSFVAMSADLWTQFINLGADEVPWWLKEQASVSIGDTSTNIAGIRIFVNHTLPAGTVIGGDRRALDFRDTGPIRAQAVNLPQGGVDIAVFGYQGTLVQDARGIVRVGVGAEGGAAAAAVRTEQLAAREARLAELATTLASPAGRKAKK